MRFLTTVGAIIFLCSLTGSAASARVFDANSAPQGWAIKGDKPTKYEFALEVSADDKKTVVDIKSKASEIEGFTTLMQKISADKYDNQRLEFTGWLKTSNIKVLGGLWMRIDTENGRVLSFDNMEKRPIIGTTDWKKYGIVLDVPKDAHAISFGILIHGTGEICARDLSLKTVSKDVPVTSGSEQESLQSEPVNLDFSAK
jgi:hypothetical protein